MMKTFSLRFKSEGQGPPDGVLAGHILNLTKKRGRSGPAVKKRIERSDAHTTKVSCHRRLHHGCSTSSRAGPKQGPGCPQHPQGCDWSAYADRLCRPVL